MADKKKKLGLRDIKKTDARTEGDISKDPNAFGKFRHTQAQMHR